MSATQPIEALDTLKALSIIGMLFCHHIYFNP